MTVVMPSTLDKKLESRKITVRALIALYLEQRPRLFVPVPPQGRGVAQSQILKG